MQLFIIIIILPPKLFPYHDKNSVDTTLSDGGSNQLHHVAIAKMDLATRQSIVQDDSGRLSIRTVEVGRSGELDPLQV